MAMVSEQNFGMTPEERVPLGEALKSVTGLREDLFDRGIIDEDVFFNVGGTEQSLDAYRRHGYSLTPGEAAVERGKRRYAAGEFKKFQERQLTKPEEKEKERVVKGMKKNKKDFKKRYGKDAESVMYATATKRAKENA